MKYFIAHTAYDGTRYAGWQVQPDKNSIQEIIESRLEKLCGTFTRIIGAGRTDAGVHALDQAFHFKLDTRLDAPDIHKGLNALLPDDIIITSLEPCSPDFHARFSAEGKHYMYLIRQGARPGLWSRSYSLLVKKPLDIEYLSTAARYFIGTHNFKPFSANAKRPNEQFERTITDFRIDHIPPFIVFNVLGKSFLYKMVRMMAGTLLRIAHKNEPCDYIARVFSDPERFKAGPAAPAHGLTLMKTFYTLPLELPSREDIHNILPKNDVLI
ncbi:MAG: tRNA pseudouridine(38-40) synthase TruA [Candidatus Auribacterota bacterium]